MARLIWDEVGQRFFETGVKNGVLYVQKNDGSYENGVVWNGLTAITESPSGAEETPLYADDVKYLTLRSAEEFGATIEAFTYPEEFEQCDGSAQIATGVTVGQQARKAFALCYRTAVGNDIQGQEFSYKLHIIYGCTVAPSEKSYSTINDNPEAITFSWELSTVPVPVDGFKPTASLVIDANKVEPGKLQLIENALFGDAENEATLLLPNQIMELMKAE
jgi:hypothetical protein